MRKLILLTSLTGPTLDRMKRAFGPSTSITVVDDMKSLLATPIDRDTSLVSFGTSVIVPAALLVGLSKPAYNVHSASPEFPGRDPHHFAIYRGVETYGATLHLMTARVDDGAIVAVETFLVGHDATPDSLLDEANQAAMCLIERYAERLLDPEPMPTLPDVSWGPVKTRRSDFLRLCRVSPLISAAEFDRRRRVCASASHANVTIKLHDRVFRIEQAEPKEEDRCAFSEFTETGFLRLVRQLKSAGYRFVRYGDRPSEPHVLWCHDVDVSMHRAVRLAEMEMQEGIVAAYFVSLRSRFYNIFEPEIEGVLRRIQSFGHEIGLLFDASAYESKSWSEDKLNAAVRREQVLLESLLQSSVRSVRWLNPDQSNLLEFEHDEIAGLSNAHSAYLRRDYHFCSDSNGYWLFKPMREVIAAGHARLHLLTHPHWWTPEAMSPSERIDRALLGRARRLRGDYDHQSALAGPRIGGI